MILPPKAVSKHGFGLLLLSAWLNACVPWIAGADPAFESVGAPGNGLLSSPAEFMHSQNGSIDYRKLGRNQGTRELVSLLEDAAQRFALEFPQTRLVVGDFSGKNGGFISEHASHRTGRDVDLAFFLTDMQGGSVASTPMVSIDRFGIGLRGARIVRFDVARNWAIVKSLLQSSKADVQWIFVSVGLKAMMLAYAVDKGESTVILDRALRVLHQPGDAAPHDDHFHVRIFCPRGDAGAFCQPTGPVRPWRDNTSVKSMTDERRLELALSALSPGRP